MYYNIVVLPVVGEVGGKSTCAIGTHLESARSLAVPPVLGGKSTCTIGTHLESARSPAVPPVVGEVGGKSGLLSLYIFDFFLQTCTN